MATATEQLQKSGVSGEPYRFTRERYEAMIEAGILNEDDKVELIAGKILHKKSIGPSHASTVKRLNQLFHQIAGDRFIVSVQDPIALDEFSEPEPDIALLRPRADFYARSHPRPDHILLIVEVADSSVLQDRQRKIPLYAAAGVAEVWLINLDEHALTRYSTPYDGSYREVTRHSPSDTLPVPGITKSSILLADLGL